MVPKTKTPSKKTKKPAAAKRRGKTKSGDKKLRISHIHWGFPPIIGGVETHLAMMLPTFVRMGHRAYATSPSLARRPRYRLGTSLR